MSGIYDNKENETDDEGFGRIDLGINLDEAKDLVDDLTKVMQDQHMKEAEEQGKGKKNKKKKKQRQKSGGTICYCGAPGCGIGPFVETD
jgi:hypothetical protein